MNQDPRRPWRPPRQRPDPLLQKPGVRCAPVRMIITLLSIVASLFPSCYRRRWFHDADLDVKRGAVLSGLAQIVVPGLTLWLRYPAYYNAQLAAAYTAVEGRGGPDHIREGFAGF